MDIQNYMTDIGRAARKASRAMAKADTAAKNRALQLIAAGIRRDAALLTAANQKDLDVARANGLAAAMVDRLTLSEKAIATMAEGLEQIASLPDPIGEISELRRRPSGISVGRMRVPDARSAGGARAARAPRPSMAIEPSTSPTRSSWRPTVSVSTRE